MSTLPRLTIFAIASLSLIACGDDLPMYAEAQFGTSCPTDLATCSTAAKNVAMADFDGDNGLDIANCLVEKTTMGNKLSFELKQNGNEIFGRHVFYDPADGTTLTSPGGYLRVKTDLNYGGSTFGVCGPPPAMPGTSKDDPGQPCRIDQVVVAQTADEEPRPFVQMNFLCQNIRSETAPTEPRNVSKPGVANESAFVRITGCNGI